MTNLLTIGLFQWPHRATRPTNGLQLAILSFVILGTLSTSSVQQVVAVQNENLSLQNEEENGKPILPHPSTNEFREARHAKAHTLVVLAFDSSTRYAHFLHHIKDLINSEQRKKAFDLIDSYAPRFKELMRRRDQILNEASTAKDVPLSIKNNRVDTLLLVREIHINISRNILTQQQREILQSSLAERQAKAKTLEEEMLQQLEAKRKFWKFQDQQKKADK